MVYEVAVPNPYMPNAYTSNAFGRLYYALSFLRTYLFLIGIWREFQFLCFNDVLKFDNVLHTRTFLTYSHGKTSKTTEI